ncbi:hypothetical protein POM88_047551 [Heracleum sosnowskyi]|uniref:Glyoxalase At5g48480-like N-terminal domain-containing protein n=1 Tax=Heracleum sosnowskyi TaxID=360622 RepID=A0AAD8GUE1_9APIA|nr:hypothetical protein POM88_047551 [Heracleum sosnowskyi]
MSKERGNEVKQGENGLIMGSKIHIFIDEPYGPEAIEFYKFVFGAFEFDRVYETIETGDEIKGDVRLISSQLQFGSTNVIVSELLPDSSWLKKRDVVARTPRGVMLVYMEDVGSVVDQALECGSVEERRDFDTDGVCINADVRDPYGILWRIRPACKMSDGSSCNDSPTFTQDIPKETDAYPQDLDEGICKKRSYVDEINSSQFIEEENADQATEKNKTTKNIHIIEE